MKPAFKRTKKGVSASDKSGEHPHPHEGDVAQAEVERKQSDKKSFCYFQDVYPPDHWVWTMGGEEYLVGTYKGFHIKLNPSDRRGLRLIVCLGDDVKTLAQTWNRAFSLQERKTLYEVTLLVEQWLREEFHVPDVQILQAGNNAHRMLDNGIMQLGHEGEPLMLHTHIICRGPPTWTILDDVPLLGPAPGKIFDLRGEGSEQEGQKKLKWNPHDRIQFLEAAKLFLRRVSK